jgi:hypothetical protein
MHEAWTEDTDGLLEAECIDRAEWRRQRDENNPAMQRASRAMFGEWLESLG